ncbi:hypothetical protein JL720_560 [Aureococcus anophagefferens]|nr:hypothetical protein JL720_560 [Aureococcus anophagefferens]
MTAGPPTTLEGWLTKDKKSKGFGFGSSETRRWFKVKAITPDPGSKRSGGPAKMALCYYKSDRDREPRGWMFLRDITAIREAGPKCFVVEHPSRSYVLHAATTGEHADWVAGLKELVADAQGATKAKPAPAKAPPKKLEDPALYEYGSLDDGRGSRRATATTTTTTATAATPTRGAATTTATATAATTEPPRRPPRPSPDRRGGAAATTGTAAATTATRAATTGTAATRARTTGTAATTPVARPVAPPPPASPPARADEPDFSQLADEMDDILNDGPASPSPEKPAPKRAAFDFVPPERDDAPRGRGARHAPEYYGENADPEPAPRDASAPTSPAQPPRETAAQKAARERAARRRDDDQREAAREQGFPTWEDEDESAFRCGDAVVVQGSRGEPSREGVVVRVRPGERYDVDYDRGGDREGRARGVPPARRALKQRSPKKPEPLARRSGDDSPQFDDEIDLGAEALDDTAARRRARGAARRSSTTTRRPGAARSRSRRRPSSPRREERPQDAAGGVGAARRGAEEARPARGEDRARGGGDELDIQWGDGSKPRKSKPKSALAKRLEEGGSRKPSKRSRAKPEKRVDDSDDENVEDDLLAERERLNRIKALADARRDSAKAAKKKVADKEKESKKKKKDKAEDSKPKAPSLFGGVRPDDGFVDDDWDASLDSPAARKALPAKGGPIGGFGAVKPDADFLEDWDPE